MATTHTQPCVFLDRDGIVNQPPPDHLRYVLRPEDFQLLPDFPALLQLIHRRGYVAVIVTNQRGVGLGKMSEQDLSDIHDKMRAHLKEENLDVLDVLVCPHVEENHPDRKPNPGMILKAARKHNLDLARSWMIGDSERDVEAGHRAGCRTILVRPAPPSTRADFRVDSLRQLMGLLELHL